MCPPVNEQRRRPIVPNSCGSKEEVCCWQRQPNRQPREYHGLRSLPSAAVFEKQVVTTLEPGTRALMLPGIVFLLVTWNRCASGLTLTR